MAGVQYSKMQNGQKGCQEDQKQLAEADSFATCTATNSSVKISNPLQPWT